MVDSVSSNPEDAFPYPGVLDVLQALDGVKGVDQVNVHRHHHTQDSLYYGVGGFKKIKPFIFVIFYFEENNNIQLFAN